VESEKDDVRMDISRAGPGDSPELTLRSKVDYLVTGGKAEAVSKKAEAKNQQAMVTSRKGNVMQGEAKKYTEQAAEQQLRAARLGVSN